MLSRHLNGRALHSSVLVLAVLTEAGGCRETLPFLVVENGSAHAIRVTYIEHAAPGVDSPNGPRRCLAAYVPPVVLPTEDVDLYFARGDPELSPGVELDPENCEAHFDIGPGFSGAFQPSPFCADHAESPKAVAGRIEPNFDYLSIETAAGKMEWRGWDTARQFKRARRWCVLRVGESQ